MQKNWYAFTVTFFLFGVEVGAFQVKITWNIWENQRKHTIKILYLKNWTVKVFKNLTTCC